MELAPAKEGKFSDMVEQVVEKHFSEVTMQELDNKIRELKDFDAELDALEAKAAPIKERRKNLEQWLISCFNEHNRSSYRSAYGLLVVSKRYSVTVPSGVNRERFREYLEGKDAFDAMWSVNSNKLNAWHKKEMEAAHQAGNVDFSVPGIGDPIFRSTLSLRKR